MRLLFVALAGAILSACGPAPVPGGTVEFRFTLSDQVKSSPNLTDPLLGSVYGNIFLQEDVGVFGPRDGAMEFGAVEVKNVDLRTEKTSAENFITAKLPLGKYLFLGFYDVDGNGATKHDPDKGDPVTLALTNKFEITDGVQAKRIVLFEIVFN